MATLRCSALRVLDDEKVFGGSERAQLVLGLWRGDQSNEDRAMYAHLLNPPAVVDRFVRELEAGSRAFELLQQQRRRGGES